VVACCLVGLITIDSIYTSPAVAQNSSIAVPSGPLDDALLEVSSQYGVEILFDQDLTKGLRTSGLRGRYTPEAALQRLLQPSGLTLRRSTSGAFVIERPQVAPLERQDVTVPELLVIGRRSQNADIRRMESDIQPYRVATGRQILQSDRDNLDQFFQSRVPANTFPMPARLEKNGEAYSTVDLRGMGAEQTLILINGRRMPRQPEYYDFRQPDLNALPQNAIGRVEILTGSAGGIYGFGALGGVVNVVTAQDRKGAEIHVSSGLSSRGDAFHSAIQGGFAAAPGDGRTEVALFASQTREEPLLNRDRDYLVRDALLIARNSGDRIGGRSLGYRNYGSAAPLRLKPEYGGTTLGGSYTQFQLGGALSQAELIASLTQNAGKADSIVAPGALDSWIGSPAQSKALLANVRRRFDSGFEVYFDAVLLRNTGRSTEMGAQAVVYVPQDHPRNPFTTAVYAYLPVDEAHFDQSVTASADRYTGGFVAPLFHAWRVNAELNLGAARYDASIDGLYADEDLGQPPDPFGGREQLQAEFGAYVYPVAFTRAAKNHYRDLSLRLAGPLFETSAGVATLTVLAEQRRESVPYHFERGTVDGVEGRAAGASYRDATTSYSAELKAPLFDSAAVFPLLRGLEVQLALRQDRQALRFRGEIVEYTTALDRRFAATAYTIGAKATPASWLMLRTSYAAGSTPPPLLAMISFSGSSISVRDPQRGNTETAVGEVVDLFGGFEDLRTVKATTFSLGGMLGPFGDHGPRLTLDYSRIRKFHDVIYPNVMQILTDEDLWPDRVARDPLSDADRALGYTAGPIRRIDARALNAGSLISETLDGRIDWRSPVAGGALRLYGDTTYYLRQLSSSPIQPSVDLVGYIRRPLRWRGNAGAEWSKGSMTIGVNAQHFDSYRVHEAVPTSNNAWREGAQGGLRVAAQTYVDVHAAWRLRNAQLDFGIVNVFDRAPSREALIAYSPFGDPRRRRFVLNLSANF
jgi:outer membrane receptor protein involved in Fe transport